MITPILRSRAITSPSRMASAAANGQTHCRCARRSGNGPARDSKKAPEAIVFELKEPFRVVERLLSPGRDNRLYAGKCHPAGYGARPADFVHEAARGSGSLVKAAKGLAR